MEELVEAHHIAKNTLGHTEFTLMQKILWTLWERCEEVLNLVTPLQFCLAARYQSSFDNILFAVSS
jgi:tRNA(Arg) A34 adenosine deaminase TadA